MSEPILEFKNQYSFLSNFYGKQPIPYSGYSFKTAEHLFNALKTTDRKEAEWVMAAPTPGEAKSRGRAVTLKPNWDEVERFKAMRTTLGYKFTGIPYLAKFLVNTGDSLLVEGNTWHDQVWGNCTCGRPACSEEGQNHLGKLLMELREDLRKWVA